MNPSDIVFYADALIGNGAFGSVYRAVAYGLHQTDSTVVAVKTTKGLIVDTYDPSMSHCYPSCNIDILGYSLHMNLRLDHFHQLCTLNSIFN